MRKRTPGRPKVAEDGINVRVQILTIASRLFMERGYSAVSLQHIAGASGVTKASVYYYYENKANLFTSAIVHMMGNIHMYTTRILRQEGSLNERLTRVAHAYLQTSHVDFESLMKEAAPELTETQMAAMREAETAVHVLLQDTFVLAMEQGEIRKGNPLFMSVAFYSLMKIGQRASTPALFASREEAAREIVAFFWSGVS